MDAVDFKSVVLGLIFLKYVTDAFEEKYGELVQDEYKVVITGHSSDPKNF